MKFKIQGPLKHHKGSLSSCQTTLDMTAINFSISYNVEMYLFKAKAIYENCGIRMKSMFRELHECTKLYTSMIFGKLLFTHPKKKQDQGLFYVPVHSGDSSEINETEY